MEVFFSVHDPTTLNRQGGDIGTQYRSVIFYNNSSQKAIAEAALVALSESQTFSNPVVTLIEPLDQFYQAEAYHVNYYAQHGDESYCALVIRPKMDKFKKKFAQHLKSN